MKHRNAIVLIGPPGSGKTSLVRSIVTDFDAAAVEAGDILREEAGRETEEAREIGTRLERGDLVSDELVTRILRKRIGGIRKDIVLFDGYPRSVEQADSFFRICEEERLSLAAVMVLEVSDGTIRRRLSGRRICPSTGTVYNIHFDPKERLRECPDELVQREDDREDVVQRRLATYHRETDPVVGRFEERSGNVLHRIAAEGSKDDVYRTVRELIGNVIPDEQKGDRMAEKQNAEKQKNEYIRWFEDLGNDDVSEVGGKNASLGEMIRAMKEEGVRVPDGFATTARAYREFLSENNIDDKLRSLLDGMKNGDKSLEETGKAIRSLIRGGSFPDRIAERIRESYRELSKRSDRKNVDVAVRSSGTAEDLPSASFAGQQETFLNVTGEDELLEACRNCFASLFTDRAISYREDQGFDHLKIALSVGVQKMVRSDKAGSGVMFSIDTDTGFPDVVFINAAWGLGENVVQGAVNPDSYLTFKPLLDRKEYQPIIEKERGSKEKKMVYAKGGSAKTRNVDTSKKERNSFVLSDDEILRLSRWAVAIEKHYDRPMDMEWAKDGDSGELFIVQARPETVQSQKEAGTLRTYRLEEKGEEILTGLAIGQAVSAGKAQLLDSPEQIDRFEDGAVLVTGMTDPDWVPIMKRASGIITDHGGRTSHAAIVSRELGIPAVVGTGNATETIRDGQEVTLSCASGSEGTIYDGKLKFEARDVNLGEIPDTGTTIMMNIASPAGAFRWWRLPVKGIGLARMEFIVGNIIKVHPMALAHFDELEDREAKKEIRKLTAGYEDKTAYFVDHLSRGIARIAASMYPDPVIVRMSDFKTNEYAGLVGGREFEPEEENPMLGFRGASRYYNDRYRDGFVLECRAIRRVREEIGLDNVIVMIPFCRTLEEADKVQRVMAENGLERGKNGLQVYVMAEIPSNIIEVEQFAEKYDGFSIGTNDLTQLALGVDRDSAMLQNIYDERNPTVKALVRMLIDGAHRKNRKVGLCGQAPSDKPDFAAFLVEAGIDSISINPDSALEVISRVAETERGKRDRKESAA